MIKIIKGLKGRPVTDNPIMKKLNIGRKALLAILIDILLLNTFNFE
jgi:hypothetical protein